MRFSPAAVAFLFIGNLSRLSTSPSSTTTTMAEGFQFTSNALKIYRNRDVIRISMKCEDRLPASRNINKNQHNIISSDGFGMTTTTSTPTNDPDTLFKLVEELTMEELTPELKAKIEKVEIALSNFLEEKGAALLERQQQESKPHPPSIPPPATLLEDPDKRQFLGEHEILRQAEELLQKSRAEAKQRKAETGKCTVTAVVTSTAYTQQKQQQGKKHKQLNSQVINKEILNQNYKVNQNQAIPPANIAATRKRPTMELGSLVGTSAATTITEGKQTTKLGRTIDNNNDTDDANKNTTLKQRGNNKPPEGIPIIFNWKQNDDGSVTGEVSRSPCFNDGAMISTSIITQRARGGTIVTTASGSRYFLEELPTKPSQLHVEEEKKLWIQKTEKKILSKKTIISSDDGKISRLKDVGKLSDRRNKGTIAISKKRDDDKIVTSVRRKKENMRSAMQILENALPRSTFSLLDLLDGEKNNRSKLTTYSSPSPSPAPPTNIRPPTGTPTLTRWNINADGTITGLIFGSRSIGDGYLVTTSPIVKGRRKQFEMVKTATGSLYFLG